MLPDLPSPGVEFGSTAHGVRPSRRPFHLAETGTSERPISAPTPNTSELPQQAERTSGSCGEENNESSPKQIFSSTYKLRRHDRSVSPMENHVRLLSDIEKAEVAGATKTAIHSSIDHGTLFGEGNTSVLELHGVSPIDSPVSQVDFPDISPYVAKSNPSSLSSGTILSEVSSPFVKVGKQHVHSVDERCGSRRAICHEQLSQFGPVADWSDDNDSFELLASFPFLKGANIEPLPSPPDVLILIDEKNRFLVYSFENDQIYVFGHSFEEGLHNYLFGSETGYQGVSERVDDNTGEGMKDTMGMGSEVFMISATTGRYNSRELALSHIRKCLQD